MTVNSGSELAVAAAKRATVSNGTVTALNDEEFWSSVRSPVSRRLLEVALECFAARGYHATTTRAIARLGGLSPGGIYVHFASKADLLYELALWGHHSSLFVVEQAMLESHDADHETRLKNVIRALVTWHVDHQDLARVVAYDQSALPEEKRATLRPFRRRFFEIVEGDIMAGHKSGDFQVVSSEQTTRALLSLCTDVCRWYRSGHGPGVADLADAYADIAIRLVRESYPPPAGESA